MKFLIIGGGAREHAIGKKIFQQHPDPKIFFAPGNAGTEMIGTNVPISDIAELKEFARENKIDLTIVGPELPLSLGIVNEFRKDGFAIFGPTKEAAQLETSKVFAKGFMLRHGIPTASFQVSYTIKQALRYIADVGYRPLVIKADGPAAGKGVLMCDNKYEAEAAVENLMIRKIHGSAGEAVVIEEKLDGWEVSCFVVTDGKNFRLLGFAQDHKRLLDADKGPNTGGMGAYSPVPIMTPELEKEIIDTIVSPTIRGMEEEKIPYSGVLFFGLMITESGPNVLEYNCRFGDPETQVILPLIKDDFCLMMIASATGVLSNEPVSLYKKFAVCVVIAARGYPDSPRKGDLIDIERNLDGFLLHAGTKSHAGRFFTDGGRVLSVTAISDDMASAVTRAYEDVKKITFAGMQFRTDIGREALQPSK